MCERGRSTPKFDLHGGIAQFYLNQTRNLLSLVNSRSIPDRDCVVWPIEFGRETLIELDLGDRTRNCLRHFQFQGLKDAVTIKDLMQIPGFGRGCLKDLLRGIDIFLDGLVRTASDPEQSTKWDQASELLKPLIAVAYEFRQAEDLSEILNPGIISLARTMGVIHDLKSIQLEELIEGTKGPISSVLTKVGSFLDEINSTQTTVINQRLLQVPPTSLESIGHQTGLTRERIRQVQVAVDRRISQSLEPELHLISTVLSKGMPPIARLSELEQRLNLVIGMADEQSERLLRRGILNKLGYSIESETYIRDDAKSVISTIRETALTHADDVGLVKEASLIECLPNDSWIEFWPLLRSHLGMHMLGDYLALRRSAKARVKAALYSLGRVASKQEIANVSGLSLTQISGALSNVQSIARASKDEWGLSEWIDDEYDGIVGEIIQRIEEDGGSTSTSRLVNELPMKFGVSEVSVRAFMQTSKFKVDGDWISLADKSSVQLKHLDDVAHGFDENRKPYWTFPVESRLFRGYSVSGFPPEFAVALGCEPDGSTYARVENLPNCRSLSVRWSLASTTGASLGFVSEALQALEIQAGQTARVVFEGLARVTLSKHQESINSAQSMTNEIIQRMKKRRHVF